MPGLLLSFLLRWDIASSHGRIGSSRKDKKDGCGYFPIAAACDAACGRCVLMLMPADVAC